jgi:hypothetical protein
VLFGPSDPSVWAPPQPHVQVIRSTAGVMAAIPVTEVLERIRAAG